MKTSHKCPVCNGKGWPCRTCEHTGIVWEIIEKSLPESTNEATVEEVLRKVEHEWPEGEPWTQNGLIAYIHSRFHITKRKDTP